jgi:taurine---2-oxoglutarate transaminase
LGSVLAKVTPGNLDHFLYTLGGADANENAIKLARAYTGRHKILARYRSYHGASLGALSATGDPRRVAWEPDVAPGVVHFLDPYRYRSTFHRTNPDISEQDFCLDYLNHLEEIIQFEGPQSIAAILIEPVTGTNGVIIPPAGYLEGIRQICDRHQILFIADEVMSGFGRTGTWFGVDHWSVVPDLMTMAKGLTSGYAPLGAVAMKPEIAHFFDERVYQGGLTYNGHPISLAAAVANIQVLEQDHLVEHAAEMGKVMSDMNAELMGRHPSVGDVRNIGLFGIIELVKNRKTKDPITAFNTSSPVMIQLKEALLKKGLFIYTHWHTILLLPPLCITQEQLQEGYAILDDTLVLADQSL